MSGPTRRVDVAVVGAGIAGTMIARELTARVPGASVVLLDRAGVGSGATRRSAGLHMPRGRSPEVRRMALYSQGYYDKLSAERPELPLFPVGMHVVAPTAMRDELPEIYLGTATPTPVPRSTADVRLPADFGVWQVEGGRYADVHGLAQALARDLRGRVTLLEGVRVTGLEPVADGVLLRLGTGRELHADRVVLAPGPWIADPAWAELVAPAGLRVKRVVALHIERTPAATDPAVIFQPEDAFLLPMHHRGHWLFSYTCPEWDVAPDDVAESLAERHLDQAREILARYAPGLVEHCASGRVFCDAYSPGRRPEVRTLDDAGRIVFAGAANGSGYQLAPAIAASTVDRLHPSA